MDEATAGRTVSELIEIWQDWSLFPDRKKRRRRWTMDDTIPSSSLDDESVEEHHKKKRHQGRRIETSLSYPEGLVRERDEELCGGVDDVGDPPGGNNLLLHRERERGINDVPANALPGKIGPGADINGNESNENVDHSPLTQTDSLNHETSDDLKAANNALWLNTASHAQMSINHAESTDNNSNNVASRHGSGDDEKVQMSASLSSDPSVLNHNQLLSLEEKTLLTDAETPLLSAYFVESPNNYAKDIKSKVKNRTSVTSEGVSEEREAAQRKVEGSSDLSLSNQYSPVVEIHEKSGDVDDKASSNDLRAFFVSVEQPNRSFSPLEYREADITFLDSKPRQRHEMLHTHLEASSQSIKSQQLQQVNSSDRHDISSSDNMHEQSQRGVKTGDKRQIRNVTKKRKSKRCSHIAVVEQDASCAFSPYRPILKMPANSSRDSGMTWNTREVVSKSNTLTSEQIDVSIQPSIHNKIQDTQASTTPAKDSIQFLMQRPDDPILMKYVEKLNFVDRMFYDNVQPYYMGKRNLPLNQLEVVLRRRAIKKRDAVQAVNFLTEAINLSASADDESTQSSYHNSDSASAVATVRGSSKTTLMHHPIPRPPSKDFQSSNTSRRTLFPNSHGHYRSHSLGMDTTFEDDSTISSTTVASAWTTGNTSTVIPRGTSSIARSAGSQSKETNTRQTLTFDCLATDDMPREEVVGDTSLGLKLTILHGKVIVQGISPLDDGRASPAQQCGLFRPGDILVAVNGFSLINGNIHSPVPMDKMLAVLKPLSQPIEGGDGRYTREVRLRFVIGEGRRLLREQRDREERKQRIMEERKKMGLDGKAGAATIDPAADIFGLSALMGVDQHTGMPMFQHHHLEIHDDDSKEHKEVEDSLEESLIVQKLGDIQVSHDIHKPSSMPSLFTKTPPLLQSLIAHQVAVDRQWMRNRYISEFFTLDSNASLLLRAPSPLAINQPEDDYSSSLNPIEARKKRLQLGSANVDHAKEIVSNVEKEERGVDLHSEEDPMEVASRICGTASVRTGASRRRWHRGDSAPLEDAQSTAVSASSMENYADTNTLRSGESVEACDHRLLVDLAANNLSWKRNVMIRLEEYASDTAKTSTYVNNGNLHGPLTEDEASSTLDSLLFGREVANILGKKKNSLALPPGEMTQMLFDLKEHLESRFPVQIFMNDHTPTVHAQERAVTFAKSPMENNTDISKATDFLVNDALGVWLQSFRPLPWKQRRALWPLHLSGTISDSASMVSSHFDDGMSMSIASTGPHSKTGDKRNLREIIEELELDPETRRETCSLVTFYFTRKYLPKGQTRLSENDETDALSLVDAYGSYLDLHKTLVFAGNLKSQPLIKKLVGLAKFDPQHREAMKVLQKAKVLLFYEPNLLSALHELLQSGAYDSMSTNFDMIRLLVSAYPDLTPMSVRAASCKSSSDFYFNYLSLLMHPEEGSDAAKRDGELVKEWCSMLSSTVESNHENMEDSILSFYHVASASDECSTLYHRDLPFLLELSIKMSEYDLALDIVKEILSSSCYRQQSRILESTVQHLRKISDIAITGELNASMMGRIIGFFTDVSKNTNGKLDEFDIVSELLKLLQQCIDTGNSNPSYDVYKNLNKCLAVFSENASPPDGLTVLSKFELTNVELPSIISAVHTLLTRGARESVGKEISGSLLRIQRAREEGRYLVLEESVRDWTFDNNDSAIDEEESDSFIWPSVLDGRITLL